MRETLLGLGVMALVATATPARAWEAQSTHAGLTEQAALASGVHQVLVEAHGRDQGLFHGLAVSPKLAATLFEKIRSLDPSGGFVPDGRGRQPALGWLVAGSVLEDMPASRGENHFYDPVHRTGLTNRTREDCAVCRRAWLWARLSGQSIASRGLPAPEWIRAPENELGLGRFWQELEASATASTAEERDRRLAFALLVAGAQLHVLQDLGSPSRARDDLAEHLLPLGGGQADRGSRFERLAALVHGRLGVPRPPRVEKRDKALAFFTGEGGLADRTAARYFSYGTLPGTVTVKGDASRVLERVLATLRFPAPRPASLDLARARSEGGAYLYGEDGECLARYRARDGQLSFDVPDECAVEQIGAILPEVGAYSAGYLAWLFRGVLSVDPSGTVSAGDVALGEGTLQIFFEDPEGTRRPAGNARAVKKAAPGAGIGTFRGAPSGTTRVVAVFRGKDAAGEELVAVGHTRLGE